jgi:hypothetical protein
MVEVVLELNRFFLLVLSFHPLASLVLDDLVGDPTPNFLQGSRSFLPVDANNLALTNGGLLFCLLFFGGGE